MSGALLVDKPTGITSARAVAQVKRLLPKKTKIGHTGTLDPLASGLLILPIGRATRLSKYVTSLDKTYTATARLGAISDTLDAEGEITELEAPLPDEADLKSAARGLTGDILQIPPMASAVKVGGARLYDLHRRGVTIERKSRPVTVHSLEVASCEPPHATFDVACSSGTYVRTLISDLAESLGSGAYLANLRRNSVGHLTVERAITLDKITESNLYKCIIPTIEIVSHLPVVGVDEDEKQDVHHGRSIAFRGITGSFQVQHDGELLAIYQDAEHFARPEVVLCAG